MQTWLQNALAVNEAVAGTVHRVADADTLELVANVNIPGPVAAAAARVPKGKGMAGLAWSREQPVSTCNLKKDQTGDVRPGAKAVDAQAAVAVPIRSKGLICAVIGLAWSHELELSPASLERLAQQLQRDYEAICP